MTDNRTTERVDHPPRVREAIDELMREKDAADNRTAELLRCLENDWNISASWDGLRRFWNIELTEEGDALADDLLTCNKEREQYRELFSEALTLAAEIVNLQP